MHLRWYTKWKWASDPFLVSCRQRRSNVNGAFTSCCSDSSWGTISSSSASSFSFSLPWTSWATPCNSISLRSPFCARCYRNEYVLEWQCLLKLECYLLGLLRTMHCWCITRADMQTNIRSPIISTQTTNLWSTKYFQPVLLFPGEVAVVTSFTAQI